MNTTAPPDRFYSSLPIFRDFTQVMDPALFRALPDDWVVGVADIVQSTKAIAENRYKAVNMAGAARVFAVPQAPGDPAISLLFCRGSARVSGAAAGGRSAREGPAPAPPLRRGRLERSLRPRP